MLESRKLLDALIPLIDALSTDPTQSAHAAAIRDDIRNNFDIAPIISSDAFARDMLNDDRIDYIDAYDAIAALIPNSPALLDLAAMTEICPIHAIALEICIDDQNAECAQYH